MAVRIRLKRTGRRNRPFYRICVFDSRTRRDGAPVEELGSYDPRGLDWGQKLTLNRERAYHWLSVGALPSETVASFLRRFRVFKNGPVPDETNEPEFVTAARQAKEEQAAKAAAAAAPTPVANAAPEAAEAAAESATGTAVAEAAPEADAAADDKPADSSES